MKLDNFIASINKKILVILGASALLLTIFIVAILIINDYRVDNTVKRTEQVKMAYDLGNLFNSTRMNNLCDLIYPEIIDSMDLRVVPYRELNYKWSEKEVDRLWQKPKAEDIDYFTAANHQLIWDILKDAP